MDLDFVSIDVRVERLHGFPELWSSSRESIEREPNGLFASCAHREDVGSKLAKLAFEIPAGVCGRPAGHLKRMPRAERTRDLYLARFTENGGLQRTARETSQSIPASQKVGSDAKPPDPVRSVGNASTPS